MAFVSTLAPLFLASAAASSAAPTADAVQATPHSSRQVQVVARARIISADSIRRSSKLDKDSAQLPKETPDRIISRNAAGQIMVEFM